MDVEKIDDSRNDEELVRVIREKPDEETVLSSLKTLARRKSPVRLEVFREVVADPRHSMKAKREVVTELGTEAIPQNQAVLLEHLPQVDTRLFPDLVHALGKIGDEEAMKRLEGLAAPDDALARESLEFARSLLAYRLRMDRYLLEIPPASRMVRLTKGISFETSRAKAETVRRASEHVRKDLPAVALSETGAASFTCRKNELLLVFNEEFKQLRALRTLAKQPSLPLVLLKKGLSLDRFILEQYFFTQPSKDGTELDVMGVRPRGDLTYVGKARVSENEFTFSIGAVDTRYAPAIEVDGSYDPSKHSWNFTTARTSLNVAARENQAPIPRKASFNPGNK